MSKIKINPKVIFSGNRVQYKFKHWLNSTTHTMRYKEGFAIRQVINRKGTQRPTGYWMVSIDGNKGLSKIHENKLTNLTIQP